ncbi:MAG TPA: tripartite tricarboxylate transporter substrate binding protein [Pelomicrobium sp.]|nr:tripartite tricarboxylate transporter substrate binding protein [Pelomicrobium sp.]
MKTTWKRIVGTAAGLAAAASLLAGTQAAAEEYPSKPITIVAPYSAGGDSDLAARNLASTVAQYIGQPLVVVNRTGASGVTGSAFVKNAKPDGYTLLLARVGSQAVTPALQPNIPYKWNDFTFLGLLELNPYGCAVKPDSPYKTMQELIEAIKKNPGKLSYSTAGVGTIHQMGPQMLFSILNLPKDAATQVPFKGGGEASTALLGGHVDFGCANIGTMINYIRAGQLRPLMVTTPERFPELKDVPTARELGYPDMEVITGWSALYGPPGMDKALVAKWSEALALLAKDKSWVKLTSQLGSVPQIKTPAETEAFAKRQFETYDKLGRELGLRKE